MRDHGRIGGMVCRVVCQLVQKGTHLLLDVPSRGTGLPAVFRWVQPSFQFDQPSAVPFELPILCGERLTPLRHGDEPLQQRMPPFSRLRRKEASKRAKS